MRLLLTRLLSSSSLSLEARQGPTQSHLSLAHSLWRATAGPGDTVVDATCGRGHDTEVLASLVGVEGRTFAMDIDASALASCRERVAAAQPGLEAAGAFVPVLQNHASPPAGLGARRAKLVVFNLGYLPSKGDAAGVPKTAAESTIDALADWALGAVAMGGAASVAVYPGHASGAREAVAVRAFSRALNPSVWRATEHVAVNHARSAPFLVSLHRLYREGREAQIEDEDFRVPRDAALRALAGTLNSS